MTLILAAGTSNNAIVVSDRRLTIAIPGGAEPINDEANKATVLTTRDARVVVAFTGLAGDRPLPGHRGPPPTGAFKTDWWILEALGECVKPDQQLEPTLARFCARAETDFAALTRVRQSDRGVAFVVVGYRYTDNAPEMIHRTISNMRDDDLQAEPTFRDMEQDPGSTARYMLAAGMRKGLDEDEMRELGELVNGDAAPSALTGRMVHVLRRAARRPESRDYVGEQCTSVTLSADATVAPISSYHSNVGSTHIYGVNEVQAGGDGALLVADPAIIGGVPGGPLRPIAGPKIGRNKPCWCGSGKKFKKCHGA